MKGHIRIMIWQVYSSCKEVIRLKLGKIGDNDLLEIQTSDGKKSSDSLAGLRQD